ncbi:NAD(P)-dependent dehydrogenase, short-chain alcohol dehydrogenase family [Mycolicibacterium rutilum]|uniref:NAD(P)-dependent dehydrogenase, short-chain alcohol dehydrogenase family n=1 Tax=Mycolicibacterium rutilum TaxID=370526 RepID=A0A1H6KIT7_MYCRU|nr:NAD(P)-dependent dehydrogenase, short-chain alcohol dehydrogenase family [Mycolicibacterium rutilum]
MQRYTDRRVLITGAGSGIGQATALRILDEGGTVVAADISESGLADTATQAGDTGGRLTTVVLDVGSEESVIAGVQRAVDAMNGLDALVNGAGILRSWHFADTTLADFEHVLRVNLVGTFLVTREALPALRAGTAAAVVNFSSTSANYAHPYMAAYAASKGGIQAMTHTLALEFSKENIRFNCVQPGSISSGMTDGTGQSKQSVGPGLPDDADYTLFGKIMPTLAVEGGGMFARPDAVAAVVAMLAAPEAYFVTGTEVRIDGGTHM